MRRNADGPDGEQRLAPVGTAAQLGGWKRRQGSAEEEKRGRWGPREDLETPQCESRSDKNLI